MPGNPIGTGIAGYNGYPTGCYTLMDGIQQACTSVCCTTSGRRLYADGKTSPKPGPAGQHGRRGLHHIDACAPALPPSPPPAPPSPPPPTSVLTIVDDSDPGVPGACLEMRNSGDVCLASPNYPGDYDNTGESETYCYVTNAPAGPIRVVRWELDPTDFIQTACGSMAYITMRIGPLAGDQMV